MEDDTSISDFAEELEDRYGELPEERATLLDLARLRLLSVRAGLRSSRLVRKQLR